MFGGAKKRAIKPTPSPMLANLEGFKGMGFADRVAASPVAKFADELNSVHDNLVNKGAVSTRDADFANLLKRVDAEKIKGARTEIYRMFMADSAFFAYKSPTSSRTKYPGHVFATMEFLDKYGVQINGNPDIKDNAMRNGVLLWSDIKPQSDTRKLIVKGLVNCCSINQRKGKKKTNKKGITNTTTTTTVTTVTNRTANNTGKRPRQNKTFTNVNNTVQPTSRLSNVSPSQKMVKTAWPGPTQQTTTKKILPLFTRKDLSPIDFGLKNTKAVGNYGSDTIRHTARA
jgi:hypothetical protein